MSGIDLTRGRGKVEGASGQECVDYMQGSRSVWECVAKMREGQRVWVWHWVLGMGVDRSG